MKRTVSVILAAVLLAASLASCAFAPTHGVNARITVTSSEAKSAAVWLSERLGDALDGRVVIGTDADAYGVDLSSLEADGYIIRDLGDGTAIFARSADGLDRAARRYAKAVEAGTAIGDVTYHEGRRVKRFEIAGRDISEYTIYAAGDERVSAAASELASRIEQACGAVLAVSSDEPSAPYISLNYVRDGTLGNVGHRWSVGEDGVAIEFSDKYKPQSASLAVARFLEKTLGWMGLVFGFEDLPEANLVTVDAGASFEEKAAFDWAISCSGQYVKYEKLTRSGGGYGIRTSASHGMQNNRFAGELSISPDKNWAWDQPCWLDDEFYEVAREDIVAYIESRVAGGAVIGEDFIFVDVAHGDNSNWCTCKKCQKLYIAEGRTHAAEVVTWVNRLSEDLDGTYPGLYYGIFAYEMTKVAPKTVRPNEHVYVTYCYDRSCSAHPLEGSKCTTFDQWEYSNPELTGWIDEWLAMTKNVTVWYYGMANGLLSSSFLHTVRDDVRFLAGRGVKCVYWEAHEMGFMPSNWIAYCLHSELLWNVDMSDEEYDALYGRLLRLFFGDAAPDMRAYLDVLGRIHEYGSCYNCWGGLYGEGQPYAVAVDRDTFAANYDKLFEIIERATALADSAIEEQRMVMMSCALIYTGSLCAYPAATAAGDAARADELCARYELINERLKRYGMDMTDGASMTSLWPTDYKPTLREIFPEE